MEFRETLLAAQRNQQQKSSDNVYYKARFDPPKKEIKSRDKLSVNIQKFLAKKEEEEKQKKLDALKKRDDLLAMRDPKAMRKIQKTLKVIKSANKSVLQDAVDHENTAVTREGPDLADQDDYGYESQEAAAFYQKMMQKYSKIPDEPKFSTGKVGTKKDLNGTRERVKHALQHEDDPVPHKRRRRAEGNADGDLSPQSKYEPDKKKDDNSKSDKPKIRKPMPPPLDFNQLLKLAEQKKTVPIEITSKKQISETEPERPMTKKQKREYEEELARQRRRQERLDAEKAGPRKSLKQEHDPKEKRLDLGGIGKIPKVGEKFSSTVSKEKGIISEKEKTERLQKDKERAKLERENADREKKRLDRDRFEKLKAERERIDRELERLNKDKVNSEKPTKPQDRNKLASKEQTGLSSKKPIDLKSQNTYRIDKNANDKKGPDNRPTNGMKLTKEQLLLKEKAALLAKQKALHGEGSNKLNSQSKADVGKRLTNEKGGPPKKTDDRKQSIGINSQAGSSKPKMASNFDFDKHVSSLKGRQFPPEDVRRKTHPDDRKMKQKRRVVDSDEEYDSEMDDFIDDADEEQDYSKHIKEIFGYDRSRYRNMDDDDDPTMESSFARQQREEYISKKIGIMEDLEDMRLEAMQNKKKGKKTRRLSDD